MLETVISENTKALTALAAAVRELVAAMADNGVRTHAVTQAEKTSIANAVASATAEVAKEAKPEKAKKETPAPAPAEEPAAPLAETSGAPTTGASAMPSAGTPSAPSEPAPSAPAASAPAAVEAPQSAADEDYSTWEYLKFRSLVEKDYLASIRKHGKAKTDATFAQFNVPRLSELKPENRAAWRGSLLALLATEPAGA